MSERSLMREVPSYKERLKRIRDAMMFRETQSESQLPPELKQATGPMPTGASPLERVRNAALYGSSAAAIVPDAALWGISKLPRMPEYKFGSAQEGGLKFMRDKGWLTDQSTTPSQGSQAVLDDVVRSATAGVAGGAPIRAGIGLATGNIPKAMSGMLKYDAAVPGVMAVPGNYISNQFGGGSRAIFDVASNLVAPAAMKLGKGATFLPGSRSNNELSTLVHMRNMGMDIPNIRANADLNIPPVLSGFPDLPPTASVSDVARQARAKGEGVRSINNSAAATAELERRALENQGRIGGMLDTSVTGPATSVAPAAKQAEEALLSGVTGSVNQPRDVATRKLAQATLDMVDKGYNERARLYGELGDARLLPAVDAAPLRTAMQDVLDSFESGAMSHGTLTKGRSQIEMDLRGIVERNNLLTKGAQDAADAQLMAKWEADALNAKQLGMSPPPKPGAAGGVTPQVAPDTISPKELMQTYKDINGLWPTASQSDRYLLAKLKAGITETLDANPVAAAAFNKATQNNAEFMHLAKAGKGNTSPMLKALSDKNPEQALVDYMKQVVMGNTSAADGRRLAELATKYGSPDELRVLSLDAIKDQAAQAAYKTSGTFDETVSSAKRATDLIDKSVDFRNAVGIPEDDAVAIAKSINDATENAKKLAPTFKLMQDDPAKFFDNILTGSPDAMNVNSDVLRQMAMNNPAAERAIADGVTEAVRRKYQSGANGFRHGEAARDLADPSKQGLMEFINPDLRARVARASEAQSELEAIRPNPLGGDVPEGLMNTGLANTAGLAAGAIGASPGVGYRLLRAGEWATNLRPGRTERNEMLAKALVEPEYVAQLIGKHGKKLNASTRFDTLPLAATAYPRSIMEPSQQFSKAVEQEAAPTEELLPDWVFDIPESEQVVATPEKNDWVFDIPDVVKP